MKQPACISCIPVLLFLLTAGCTTVRSAESGQEPPKSEQIRPDGAVADDNDNFRSLADYLQRVPGVIVAGSENNRSVLVRGVSSFNSGLEPLFVIDGQTVGSSYEQANNMLNVRDIDYVRVLKGADASMYGVRGANGVILITTKRSR